MKVNPFLFWMIAFHGIFEEIVDHFELLEEAEAKQALLISGSVEEAFLYFKSK